MEFIQRSERWLQLKDLDGEIWKDVVGYENLYEVSNFGRIRTNKNKITHTEMHGDRHWKQRILKQKFQQRCRSNEFDARVILWKDGKEKTFLVSRLVAISFLDNPNSLPQINHIDGNPTNNKVENLEWCTAKHNVNHMFENKLNKSGKKILLMNKKTDEIFIFTSMSKASLFMKKNNKYIGCNLQRGITENDEYIWKTIE